MKSYFNYQAAVDEAAKSLMQSRKELIKELREMVEHAGTKVDDIFVHGNSLQINLTRTSEPFHNIIYFHFNENGTINISFEGRDPQDFSKTVLQTEGMNNIPSEDFEKLDTALVFFFKRDSEPLSRKLKKLLKERQEQKG